MKLTLMGLGLALLATGCAHGSAVGSVATDRHGSTRVAESGQMLLAGPEMVHASVDGPNPVSLFLVDRVHGDDRDCKGASSGLLVATRAHLEVGAKQELCAVASRAPAFVLWHAFSPERTNLWALQ